MMPPGDVFAYLGNTDSVILQKWEHTQYLDCQSISEPVLVRFSSMKEKSSRVGLWKTLNSIFPRGDLLRMSSSSARSSQG